MRSVRAYLAPATPLAYERTPGDRGILCERVKFQEATCRTWLAFSRVFEQARSPLALSKNGLLVGRYISTNNTMTLRLKPLAPPHNVSLKPGERKSRICIISFVRRSDHPHKLEKRGTTKPTRDFGSLCTCDGVKHLLDPVAGGSRSHLFDDERIPCSRPTHDIVRHLLDHSESPVQKYRDVVVEGRNLLRSRGSTGHCWS